MVNYRLSLWICIEEKTQQASKVYIEKVVYDPPGDDRKNLNGGYIVIRNDGADTDLEGRKVADSDSHEYTFPDLILKSGKAVTLHVGSGTDSLTDLYWGMGRPILDNSGDTIYLYDAQGNLVDEYGW